MKRVLVIAMFGLLTISLHAGKNRREVRQYDGQAQRMGAMVYALPKSHLQIEVKAICTVSKPGPFALYAERYLADNSAIIRESRVWKFAVARVKENFVADSSRMYAVTGESEPLRFDEDGLILRSVGEWDGKCHKAKHPKSYDKDVADTLFHTELLGEEALTSTSIPKMAERAAKQIFQLREARTAIMTCDVNHQPDGAATKEILERIDREERELTALFVGKKITSCVTRCFAVDPTGKTNNQIVARMSTIEGIVDADDMIGTPIYVNITPTILTPPAENKKDKKAAKGYYYNVPGSVTIVIRHGEQFTETKILDIPQNGYATWLAPSVSNIFFNHNGTIRRVK